MPPMSQYTKVGADTSLRVETVDSLQDGHAVGHGRHVRGVAAYYRLRSSVLESQVATLAAELRRERRRHQETIARYEEILQDRPVDPCVVTTRPTADD